MSVGQLKRIVIVGGGTAGWMAAAALAQTLKNSGTEIHLVESEEIGTVGVGEATVPSINAFNAFLGLDPAEFLRECKATYKLGIEFIGWGGLDRRYFHAFTPPGSEGGRHHFARLFVKYARAEAEAKKGASLDDFNLGALAARAGKIGWPTRALSAGGVTHAFHFDAGLYGRYLRRYAEARGVVRHEGIVRAVLQNPANGYLQAVGLVSGQSIEGDFFIDCSGFKGLLIKETLSVGYEDWRHWLPCDRAIAIPSSGVGAPIPYTRSTACEAGWIWRIPLQHRVGNGHVYCSAYVDDDVAESRLLSQLDGEPFGTPHRLRFTTGRRSKVWHRNCLALGLAAGFMEPLESTSIHLIQTSLFRLIGLFPGTQIEPAEVEAFNRQTAEEYEDIRDLIIAHYKIGTREDTSFWRMCREIVVPDRLKNTIDLFKARGRLNMKPEQLFTAASWMAVLYGQGVLPRGSDPLLAPLEASQLSAQMDLTQGNLAAEVQTLPSHIQALTSAAR